MQDSTHRFKRWFLLLCLGGMIFAAMLLIMGFFFGEAFLQDYIYHESLGVDPATSAESTHQYHQAVLHGIERSIVPGLLWLGLMFLDIFGMIHTINLLNSKCEIHQIA